MGTEIFNIDASWAEKLTKTRVSFSMNPAVGVTHEEVDVSSPACGTTCEAAKEAAKHGAAPRHLALSTSAQLFSRARVTQIIPTVDSKGVN